MSNPVRKMVEVEESVWTQSTGKIVIGLAIILIAGILIYASGFMFADPARLYARIGFGVVALIGLSIAGAAVYDGIQTRKQKGVAFTCPYCDKVNLFEAEPHENFDCEFCSRAVHFEDGAPVPVRLVNCPFCHTDHRVAVDVHRYVCDRCNRPLELKMAPGRAATVQAAEGDEAPHNYDVLLISVDRRHEIEVAMKLQNILVVNLPEARRLMATAGTATPLVVSHALPQRKAEAIRRQLQDVGATATLRPTNDTGAPTARPS
jgi:ribosomal protein L7/L12